MSLSLWMKTTMRMMKEVTAALVRMGIMRATIAAVVGGGASVNANRGAGGKAAGRALFCGLIGADGEHQHQPRATRPPNALVMLSALATSSPSLLMVQMLM